MKIYEINISGKTSYFILEANKINDDLNNVKRFFLFSCDEEGNYNLVRISSIGTFMEYIHSKNISIIGPIAGSKYNMVVSLIEKIIAYQQEVDLTSPNMNLMDIDSYFDENKIVRCYKLEKEDYDLLTSEKVKNI